MLWVRGKSMAVKIEQTTGTLPSVMPPDEAVAFFDQVARYWVGMSGPEFIAKWDAGDYDNVDLDETPEGRNIIMLRLLMPFGRQLG